MVINDRRLRVLSPQAEPILFLPTPSSSSRTQTRLPSTLHFGGAAPYWLALIPKSAVALKIEVIISDFRRLIAPQRDHRINFRRTSGRNECGRERDCRQ